MTYTYEYPRPALTVDIILFAKEPDDLSILLIKRNHVPFDGMWALPGGFIEIDETLEHATNRELHEETGINGIALEQFYVFDSINRDPRHRVISIVFTGILFSKLSDIKAGDDAKEVKWFSIREVPQLAFDHEEIIRKAIERYFSGQH